jgi:nicotinamide mononucleotide transporter
MSLFSSLYDAHLTISGHAITWREIVGNAFGLASAVGGMRRRIWAWPVGIVGNVLLFTVFLGTAVGSSGEQHATLLGQSGRQVFFIATSVYGWWRWRENRRGRVDAVAVVPRWATPAERVPLLLGAAAAVAACFFVFRSIGAGFPAAWWYYLADAWIFVGSMVATYAMARGWVDFWLCWLAVDLVGVPELVHFQYYPSAFLYGVYGAFVVWGFVAWLRIARDEAPLAPVGRSQGSVEARG